MRASWYGWAMSAIPALPSEGLGLGSLLRRKFERAEAPLSDIFISYKRSERREVERLAQELQRLGLGVWYDAGLNAGEAFSDEIDREAHAATAILVCWSPAARDSQWVKAEALIGFEQSKLAACYVAGPDEFYPPTPFNTIHSEDLRSWIAAPSLTHAGWRSLLRRVGRLCGREDVESFGGIDAYAPAETLRDWRDKHGASPLAIAVEGWLLAREAEDSERERLEREARERRLQEEAQERARTPSINRRESSDPRAIFEEKRLQVEARKEAEILDAIDELRWAIGAARRLTKLQEELRALFPRWGVVLRPLNEDAEYDLPELLNAAPENATDDEIRHALHDREWLHDFLEGGVFIEQSAIMLTCGEFEAEAFLRERGRVFDLNIQEEPPGPFCELCPSTLEEIREFNPPTFEKFLADAGRDADYAERIRLLKSFLVERFAEFCAVRGQSPEQYEADALEVRRREEDVPDNPPAARSRPVLKYVADTISALFFIFLLVMVIGVVAQWLGL